MWESDSMSNAGFVEVATKTMVLATPVGLHGVDLGVEETLDMSLEGVKNLLNM